MKRRRWLRCRRLGCAPRWARLLVWLLTLLPTPSALFAAGPLDATWRTLETAHFRIHFDARNRAIAERVAVVAEQAHAQLVPIFGQPITPPTDVVVIDDADIANGSARATPYDLIRVYATAPEADSTLGDSDDWLRGLVIHEYIHILHLNTVSGVSAALNAVFGKSYLPNAGLPRWLTEGLATYGESVYTEGGRLRNNAFRMYLRMDALNRSLRGVEDLGGAPIQWPGATGWYLYGSDFVDYVAREHGEQRWIALVDAFGGSLTPLAINQRTREVFGRDMIELWGDYSAAAYGEFLAEAVAVRARGETRVVPITDSGYLNGYPRCAGPSAVAYLSSDGTEQSSIRLQQLPAGELRHLVDAFGGGTFDWGTDGRTLVFTQFARYENFYAFDDLFLVDPVAGGAPRRITVGQRAREPSISPDGRYVAFAGASDAGGVDLRELELASGEVTTLVLADQFQLVSMPDYAPDGSQIVFSMWDLDWGRDIYLYDRRSGALERLTEDRSQDLEPSFSSDGRSVLFSSDRTGIYNAYELNLETGDLSQLTNVMGGVFSPKRCRPDGPLVVRTYGAAGFDIGVIPEVRPVPAPPPYTRDEVAYPEVAQEPLILEEHRYRPGRDLYPRTWTPVVSQSGDSVLLGAEAVASDPVGHHVYIATVNYSFETEHVNAGLAYNYLQLPVDLGAFVSYSQGTNASGLFAESRFVPFEQQELAAGLTLSVPFFDERSGHSVALSYAFRDVDETATPPVDPDPSDVEPRFPVFGRFDDISFGWSWGDARGFAYSVSAEEGTNLNLFLRFRSPIIGADFDSVEVGWGVRQYVENPWVDGHILALLLTGGIGRGSARRPLFAVGGFPDIDFLLSIIDETPIGSGFLRGYPQFAQIGPQFHQLNAEYRIPLFDIDVGAWTLPVFMQRVFLNLFADYGTAVEELDGFKTFLLGVGAELRLQATLGYVVPADFRLGYARGLSEGGESQLYVLYGGTF